MRGRLALTGIALAVAMAGQALAADDDSLTFLGVTLYGTYDIGVAYLNHGAPLTQYYGPGLPFLIQKFNNKPILSVAPNGLSQSKLGIAGTEPLADGISAVFRLETGFQPTSGNLSDGPRSLVINNGRPVTAQITSGDSSRAGQIFQSSAYAGLQSKEFGTLTFGRQNGLLLDDLLKYDPQAQSQAFSPIGYSGVTGGAGDTEDSRFDSSIKYALTRGPVRLALLHQFGSQGHIPGGADAVDMGGDYAGLSVDAVYTQVSGAVSASSLTLAQALAHPGTLAATISDNTSYSLQASYIYGPAKFYGGYEHVEFANPAHPVAAGATDIGGYVLSVVNDAAYKIHRILQISWIGVRYSLTPALDLTGAYYRYDQNSYSGNGCADRSASSCGGTMNALSAVADYQLTKRFDIYGGVNYSRVAGGLASGFLKTSVVAPMVGGRFRF